MTYSRRFFNDKSAFRAMHYLSPAIFPVDLKLPCSLYSEPSPKRFLMETFITVVHVLVALILVVLVLIQDSKGGGGALGIGGGGSNSILGATGAQTLAARLTRWTAVLFAITCLSLTYLSSQSQKSVIDTAGPLPTTPVPAGIAT